MYSTLAAKQSQRLAPEYKGGASFAPAFRIGPEHESGFGFPDVDPACSHALHPCGRGPLLVQPGRHAFTLLDSWVCQDLAPGGAPGLYRNAGAVSNPSAKRPYAETRSGHGKNHKVRPVASVCRSGD